jgi:tRNA G10  N-methylase Trm11
MDEFLAICNREPGIELVAAECKNLTGGKPDSHGIASCRTLEYIFRAAYINAGLHCLAEDTTLEGLTSKIAQMSFEATDFRIEFLRLSEEIKVHQFEAIITVANAIKAFPNLENPQHRFLLMVREDSFLFGEFLEESDHSYQRHDAKPWRTSSSLPSRLSRALVNLVSPPAQSILDPCCGTGSILLEAQALGLTAYGADWNPRMVGMTRKNLAYFGYTAEVKLMNACEYELTADAIVTDLPYGRFLKKDDEMIKNILRHASHLAPTAVYVAGNDISAWLVEAGYQDVEVFRITRSSRFTRYVHRARSIVKPEG